jgi:hypothetical protein
MTARCWASPSANPELKLGQNNHKKMVPEKRREIQIQKFVFRFIRSANIIPIMANVSDV